MAYLDWGSSAVEVAAAFSNLAKSRLELGVPASRRDELAAELRAVLEGAAELRLDLPRGWTTFWKLREGETRLLVAHPEEEAWVATLALTRAFLADLLAALEAGVEEPIAFERIGPLSRVGNLSVVLRVI